jgi:uncharacterized protein
LPSEKFPTQKGLETDHTTTESRFANASDNPERKLNAFQPDVQHTIQGEMMLKELIATMARALADHPGRVKVSEIEGEMSSIFELRVAKADFGNVIGKQGRNADAMRTILNVAAMKTRRRVILEIIE